MAEDILKYENEVINKKQVLDDYYKEMDIELNDDEKDAVYNKYVDNVNGL